MCFFARQVRILEWIEKNTKHTHICDYLQSTYGGVGQSEALAVAMEGVLVGVQGRVPDAEGQALSVQAICCQLLASLWRSLSRCGSGGDIGGGAGDCGGVGGGGGCGGG